MEETYGSKFDSQMNSDSSLKGDGVVKQKLSSANGKVDKIKEFVDENITGIQDRVSEMDFRFDWKKIATVVSVAGLIGGIAYYRRSKRGKVRHAKSHSQTQVTPKADKTSAHLTRQTASKKKSAGRHTEARS